MSDGFYKLVRFLGRPAFAVSSTPLVLHAERLDSVKGCILAPNHLSPYDIPCLMASTPRLLDFLSITELFQKRLLGWFLRGMNAFPLDRARVDPATTRTILQRLKRGRIVVIFPEGRIVRPSESLLAGGGFKTSVIELSRLANVPIVPCVILGTGAYARAKAWLPVRRTCYAVNFGGPMNPRDVHCLRAAYDQIYSELSRVSGLTIHDSRWREDD
jgi:1-acyl-sn-glycerol-3-phosphate acyltransferase